jgi:ATP-dependent DNA ligase
MASITTRPRARQAALPEWIKPQLAALGKAAPDGPGWLHEIKLDGYRMHARLDSGRVKIITRRGNDWTDKYPTIAKALASLRRTPRTWMANCASRAWDPTPRGSTGQQLICHWDKVY